MADDQAGAPAAAPRPRVRILLYLPWADNLEDAAAFVQRLPHLDVRTRVTDPGDARLVRMARLDCDWHGEHARCVSAMRHPDLEFLPPGVVGNAGLSPLLDASRSRPPAESWWVVFTGQHPQKLGPVAGKVFAALRSRGVRILFYAFDEASRTMPCFCDIAPHLDVLVHDERPLGREAARALRPGCLSIHRSWVANVVPFAAPFVEAPEERILFLGSQLGITDHRRRQIDYLSRRYGDRFTAISDHSVSVAERSALGRFKVGLCPEGRKFTTPAMGESHTDRPFWSGCMGMVPVSEDSAAGGRLDELAAAGLILRYPHGHLDQLGLACERALAMGVQERRRIHEYFNRNETVGTVMAEAIARAGHAAGA